MLGDLIKKSLFQNARNEFSTFTKPCDRTFVTWTYENLSDEVNRISELLEEFSNPGEKVSFLMLQGGYAYALIFASILSARTFVPLNSRQPNSQLSDIVLRSDCRILVTDTVFLERSLTLQKAGNFDVLNIETGKIYSKKQEPERTPAHRNQPLIEACPAYMVYTSGSTGTPKGVMVSTDNLLSYVQGVSKAIKLDKQERFSQCFELSFDSGLGEIFQAMSLGASLHPLISSDIPFIDKYLERTKPTVFSATPTFISLVQKNKFLRKEFESVKTSMFMGERLTFELVRFWKERFPNSSIFNLYGPTETTVNVLVHEWKPEDRIDKYGVPLGKALGKNIVKLTDGLGNIVADGIEGEITIEGPQVTMGYFRDTDSTKKSFIGNTYRTGDYAIVDNGLIHFIGRQDDQVKIRGFRLQLSEVEFRSNQVVPDVRVMAAINNSEIFLILDSEIGESRAQEIIAHLKAHLPKYAIPTEVYYLEQWPLTSSGKTDKTKISLELMKTAGKLLAKVQ